MKEKIRAFFSFAADLVFPNGKLGKLSDTETLATLRSLSFPLPYRHPLVQTLLWEMKYFKNKKAVSLLAEVAYPHLVKHSFALLIPIPSSAKHRRKKGFNQTELLAEELLRIDEGKHFTNHFDILFKQKDTPRQHSIHDRQKRFENIKDSFAVRNPEIIRDKTIVLLDDITTTGATLTEAERVLWEAGAWKVIRFPIAH